MIVQVEDVHTENKNKSIIESVDYYVGIAQTRIYGNTNKFLKISKTANL